jgi:hypothetical protein
MYIDVSLAARFTEGYIMYSPCSVENYYWTQKIKGGCSINMFLNSSIDATIDYVVVVGTDFKISYLLYEDDMCISNADQSLPQLESTVCSANDPGVSKYSYSTSKMIVKTGYTVE